MDKSLKILLVSTLAIFGVHFLVFNGGDLSTSSVLALACIGTLTWVPLLLAYKYKLALHWKILAAMFLAGLFAWTGSKFKADLSFVYPLGTIFVSLLRMVIVPLVMTSIIVGVAGIGDPKNLGRMGIKTLLYYMTTSLFAIMIGLTLVNLIKPGKGFDLPESNTAEAFNPENLQTPDSVLDIIIRMVPPNPIKAAVDGDMLGIIFFAIAFGLALTMVASKYKETLLPVIDSGFQTMMRLTEIIISLAPIGVYGLIARAAPELDPENLKSMGGYFVMILFGLLIHLLFVLPLLSSLLAKRNPLHHFSDMKLAMITAFSTSSSSATLPVTMECVEEAGVSNKVSSFVLPMGATVNMDGTALYECAGVIFIAQCLGIDFSFSTQMVIVFTALLASIGAAGIPSAGLVMIFIVLKAVGLEGDNVNMLVGIMLAIDRPLDMLRTVVNITSDSVGALVVAQSEGELGERRHTGIPL